MLEYIAWCPERGIFPESGEIYVMPDGQDWSLHIAESYAYDLHKRDICGFLYIEVCVAELFPVPPGESREPDMGPTKIFGVEVVLSPEFYAKEIK